MRLSAAASLALAVGATALSGLSSEAAPGAAYAGSGATFSPGEAAPSHRTAANGKRGKTENGKSVAGHDGRNGKSGQKGRNGKNGNDGKSVTGHHGATSGKNGKPGKQISGKEGREAATEAINRALEQLRGNPLGL